MHLPTDPDTLTLLYAGKPTRCPLELENLQQRVHPALGERVTQVGRRNNSPKATQTQGLAAFSDFAASSAYTIFSSHPFTPVSSFRKPTGFPMSTTRSVLNINAASSEFPSIPPASLKGPILQPVLSSWKRIPALFEPNRAIPRLPNTSGVTSPYDKTFSSNMN